MGISHPFAAQVIRASRIVSRWESSFSVSYAHLTVMRLGLLLTTVAHWMACLWGLSATSAVRDDQWTWITGQEKSDSTSLQRGCFRSNAREKSIHALSSPREMTARPKMSQIESKTTDMGASKVGH